MTGQSTLDIARSEETEDQLYAGSQQPLLQPQVADAASAAAWEALTSLAKDPDTFAFEEDLTIHLKVISDHGGGEARTAWWDDLEDELGR